MNDKSGKAAERREFTRFPVVEGMIEPITVRFDEP